jgi:hypothetical protein
MSFILLYALPQSQSAEVLGYHSGHYSPLVALSFGAAAVSLGVATRLLSACLALSWAWAAYVELAAGQRWESLPVRAVLFFILFAVLALTGAGRYSVDNWLRRYPAVQRHAIKYVLFVLLITVQPDRWIGSRFAGSGSSLQAPVPRGSTNRDRALGVILCELPPAPLFPLPTSAPLKFPLP